MDEEQRKVATERPAIASCLGLRQRDAEDELTERPRGLVSPEGERQDIRRATTPTIPPVQPGRCRGADEGNRERSGRGGKVGCSPCPRQQSPNPHGGNSPRPFRNDLNDHYVPVATKLKLLTKTSKNRPKFWVVNELGTT